MTIAALFAMASLENTSYFERLALILIISSAVSLAAQVDNPPQDVTVSRGQTATLMCGVNGDVSVDPFKWQQFQTDPAGSDIYRNPPGSIVAANQNKYEVEGQYNLQIRNVELQDGGLYACGVFSQNSPNKANLVVLDQPSISVGSIVEGDKLPLTCTVEYGAPSELGFGQMPEMHMRIGDNFPISGETERIEPQPGSGEYTQLRLTALYTAQGAHNDQELKCSVTTSSPQYDEMTKIVLDVRFSVRDIRISPITDEYYVTDVLNCTAFGNPDPSFRWEAISSGGARQVSGGLLTITQDMLGPNTWKCRATNTVSQTEFVEEEIQFFVAENTNPPGTPVTESGVEAWVIAVAIIIPVIVVCVAIILGILYYRRKKAAAARASGDGEKTPGYENKDFTGSSNPVDDGVIPPDVNNYDSQKKKPDHPISMNPNPNGTPAGGKTSPGEVPVYPPTHSGKDSPGYGDLGVRHLSGSGANLNVSQDSFDDGPHPRGPPAQYSNTPGSGPPSQQRQPPPQARQPPPQQMYRPMPPSSGPPPDTVV